MSCLEFGCYRYLCIFFFPCMLLQVLPGLEDIVLTVSFVLTQVVYYCLNHINGVLFLTALLLILWTKRIVSRWYTSEILDSQFFQKLGYLLMTLFLSVLAVAFVWLPMFEMYASLARKFDDQTAVMLMEWRTPFFIVIGAALLVHTVTRSDICQSIDCTSGSSNCNQAAECILNPCLSFSNQSTRPTQCPKSTRSDCSQASCGRRAPRCSKTVSCQTSRSHCSMSCVCRLDPRAVCDRRARSDSTGSCQGSRSPCSNNNSNRPYHQTAGDQRSPRSSNNLSVCGQRLRGSGSCSNVSRLERLRDSVVCRTYDEAARMKKTIARLMNVKPQVLYWSPSSSLHPSSSRTSTCRHDSMSSASDRESVLITNCSRTSATPSAVSSALIAVPGCSHYDDNEGLCKRLPKRKSADFEIAASGSSITQLCACSPVTRSQEKSYCMELRGGRKIRYKGSCKNPSHRCESCQRHL